MNANAEHELPAGTSIHTAESRLNSAPEQLPALSGEWYAGGTVERAQMAEQTATPIDLDAVIDICEQNDIAFLGVFGSHARGEATPESDVDLLVRFARRKSLLTLVRIERQFSERLGRRVDLVTEASLSPYLRERVQAEVETLYERTE